MTKKIEDPKPLVETPATSLLPNDLNPVTKEALDAETNTKVKQKLEKERAEKEVIGGEERAEREGLGKKQQARENAGPKVP